MSIFDNVDFSKLSCTRAEKNIADDYDRKYVTTRLEFCDAKSNLVFSVRSSCSRLDIHTVIYEDPIKLSWDNLSTKRQGRLKSFNLKDLSSEMKKDLDTVERLFHASPDNIKRVY